MSSKKIDYYNSGRIAEKVAAKAFEHLFNPVNDAMKAEARNVYNLVLKDAGVSKGQVVKLKEYGLIDLTSYCFIQFEIEGEDDFRFQLDSEEYEFIGARVNVPPELQEDLLLAYAPYQRVVKARNEFETRISCDIRGKTVAGVLKQWPELRGFIEDQYGSQGNAVLTTPFADLIQKYISPLMALPSPDELK